MWLVLGKSKINVDVSAISLYYRYLTAQANFSTWKRSPTKAWRANSLKSTTLVWAGLGASKHPNNLPHQPTEKRDLQSNSLIGIYVDLAGAKLKLLHHLHQKWENFINVNVLHSQRINSHWISLIQFQGSPPTEAHIFLELSIRSSPVDHLSWGSTISSVRGCTPCLKHLESFASSLSHVASFSSFHLYIPHHISLLYL